MHNVIQKMFDAIKALTVNYLETNFVLQSFNLLRLDEQSKSIDSTLAIINVIESGLPTRCIESLMKNADLTVGELSQLLQITDTSPQGKSDDVLAPLQSAQLFLIAYLFAKAHDTLGDRSIANTWLRQRQTGLNQCVPLKMLRPPPKTE